MRDYFKGIMKYPIRIIPLAVCGMILAASLSIYITISEKEQMIERVSILKEQKERLEWKVVEDIITDSFTNTKKDAKVLALETEYSLRANYSDLDVLEEQFDTYTYSEEFNHILEDVLYEDHLVNRSFLTLVGTEKHLITMFSNSKDHILKGINSDTVVDWSEIIEMNTNPALAKDSIDAIINKSKHLIFVQNKKSLTGNAEKIKSTNLSELEALYKSDGLDGIKNFSLLAPAYITDTGDLFGINDTTMLRENENHKMVIVKVINLEDVIKKNEDYINHVTSTIDNLSDAAKQQGDRNTLQGVLWSFILFLLSLLMIAVYNSEEKKGHLRETDNIDNEGGNDNAMRGE